jgi:ketosteroid isomerase-like protein
MRRCVSATSSAVSSARTDDPALVIGVWSFNGTGLDGQPVQLAARNADVLRRQSDGTWRFVIDNPWGAD